MMGCMLQFIEYIIFIFQKYQGKYILKICIAMILHV